MIKIIPVDVEGFKNGDRKRPCIFKMFHVYSDAGKYISRDGDKTGYVDAWDSQYQDPSDWYETDIDIDTDIYDLSKLELNDPGKCFGSNAYQVLLRLTKTTD